MLSHFEFRLLRKTGALPYLNLAKRIRYGKTIIRIPVVNSLGYSNLYLKPTWLTPLLDELYKSTGGLIDVGANVGQTLIAVKSSRCSIQYVGFEPDVQCCFYIKKLILANKFTSCYVFSVALTNAIHTAVLEANVGVDPTASLVKGLRPGFFSQQESVFALDYDSLPLNQSIKCIKIDVEGGELETLLGMKQLIGRERPVILCEVLDSFSDEVFQFTQGRTDEVCTFLNGLDYAVIQLIQNEATNQILSFVEVDWIRLRQWTEKSPRYNDYVFCPLEKRAFIVDVLDKLCQQG